ncbi:hypothetical protein T484DRAFT_1769119 [Baffinella frigidus]|nr:hypothetical protein T484DRAFT_1769119 [Cryptophyta sp. CCMP2293]
MADDGAEAEVEEEQSVPLSQDDVNAGLSELASSVDGTSVVFTRLALPGRLAEDISGVAFLSNVRYIDLSNNLIKDASPLELLEHLLELDVSQNRLAEFAIGPLAFLQNRLAEFAIGPLAFLQSLDCSRNKLRALEGLEAPLLRRLSLDCSRNKLKAFEGLEAPLLRRLLQTLELDNNQMASCAGLGRASLKTLTLANNLISDASGLEGLDLKSLDLSTNKLTGLQGLPTSGMLKRLILKANQAGP